MSTFCDYLPKLSNVDDRKFLEFTLSYFDIHNTQKNKDILDLEKEKELEFQYKLKVSQLEIETALKLAEIEINKARAIFEITNINTTSANILTSPLTTNTSTSTLINNIEDNQIENKEVEVEIKDIKKNNTEVVQDINIVIENKTESKGEVETEGRDKVLNRIRYLMTEGSEEELRLESEFMLKAVYKECYGKRYRINQADKLIRDGKKLIISKILMWREEEEKIKLEIEGAFTDKVIDFKKFNNNNNGYHNQGEERRDFFNKLEEIERDIERGGGLSIIDKKFNFPPNEFVNYKEDISNRELNKYIKYELELSGEVTRNGLLKAKKRVSVKYHPDKVLDKEEKDKNLERIQQLNQVIEDLLYLFFEDLNGSEDTELKIIACLNRLERFKRIKDTEEVSEIQEVQIKIKNKNNSNNKRTKRDPWWIVLGLNKNNFNKNEVHEGFRVANIDKLYDYAYLWNCKEKALSYLFDTPTDKSGDSQLKGT